VDHALEPLELAGADSHRSDRVGQLTKIVIQNNGVSREFH